MNQDGEAVDALVQTRRDSETAKRVFGRLLKRQESGLRRIVTDKMRSRLLTACSDYTLVPE